MKLQAATQVAPNRWRQAARGALLALAPHRFVLASGPATSANVSLTFDDGPDPSATPRVLTELRAAGVRATFFLRGDRVAAHPDIVRQIHAEGHDIGHHSWSHSAPSTTSAATLAAETARTRELLRQTVGLDSRLFRPPHGKLSVGKAVRLAAMGQTIVLWTSDPGDRFQSSAAAMMAWVAAHPPRAGDIILLHDSAPVLADALPALIEAVHARGLGFATVSEIGVAGRARTRAVPLVA